MSNRSSIRQDLEERFYQVGKTTSFEVIVDRRARKQELPLRFLFWITLTLILATTGGISSSEATFSENIRSSNAPKTPLFSRAAGDGMGADELARIKTAFGRNGGIIDQGAEAQAYLRLQGAEDVTFGADTILLRSSPSRSSVFEELIHTAQNRTGRFTGENVLQMEIEAAEKLIRFRRGYGIPNSETRAIIERLRAMQSGTGQ